MSRSKSKSKSRINSPVIPSEVENGATRKPRHRREGRRLSEREVSESNPVAKPSGDSAGSFDFAQDDGAANSTARLIAAIMLSGRAIPLPAISNAVP
jgi:hypothetical protein